MCYFVVLSEREKERWRSYCNCGGLALVRSVNAYFVLVPNKNENDNGDDDAADDDDDTGDMTDSLLWL